MRSRNKYDVLKWVLSVGKSAKSPMQCQSALNLIENFQRQYGLSYLNDPGINSACTDEISRLRYYSF